MIIFGRTRFKRDIVAEFFKPIRPSRRVIILCDGAPTVPAKRSLGEFLAKKGYWVFYPRYRGTWESDGKFLQQSLEQDILDVIDQLPRGFTDFYSGRIYRIKPQLLYLIGGSFGGPAALLASRDSRVAKVVAISPVVDWRASSKAEPLGWLKIFMRQAFGQGYRFSDRDWKKLTKGSFYNPIRHISEINGEKILIIHAKDDPSVLYEPVKKFAKAISCELVSLRRGGHLGQNIITEPRLWKRIKKFLTP